MSVRDLSTADFQFWKNYVGEMKAKHEDEFLREINPDLMHALYRGYKDKNYKSDLLDPTKLRNHILTRSKIFVAVNTILPNLQYQMPRCIAVPEDGTDPESAALLTATLNKYNKELRQKRENQEACLNTYFLGLSWKKVGYHVPQMPKDMQSPESQLPPDQAQEAQTQTPDGDPDSILMSGSMQEMIRHESPFNSFISPMNVHIDHRGTLLDYKVINNKERRTLQDIYDFGKYDPDMLKRLTDEYEDKEGSRFDARNVWFDVNEVMIQQRNGIWILVFCDNYDYPLYYEQTDLDEFPYYPLVFTNEPGIRYPTSHVNVASRSQRWVDEIASRYVEMIGRSRRQHYINQDILAPGAKENVIKNMIAGIIYGNRPATPGDIMEINSSPVQQDINIIMQMLGQDIQEIMGADSQRTSGISRNKTLGQDQLAAQGTEIRESGMLDKVRDWLIDQNQCMVQVLQKHSGAQMNLSVGQQDFSDPQAAQASMGQTQSIQTGFRIPTQPMPLSHFTQGKKYSLTLNVYEAVKPNKQELAQEYEQFILMASNPIVQNALLQDGVRLRTGMAAKERAKLFEYIDGTQFVEELTPQQKAAYQVEQMMMAQGMPQAPTPAKPQATPKPGMNPNAKPPMQPQMAGVQ